MEKIETPQRDYHTEIIEDYQKCLNILSELKKEVQK